jgi:prolyl oligopeptidase
MVPNLRGGGEYGKMARSQEQKCKNVFDDFIAAAEYLIAQKYVVQLLAIRGGSNGGLLVEQP